MNERIGFSSTKWSQQRHTTEGVLTIDEMNEYDLKLDVKYKSEEFPARPASNGASTNGSTKA
jgi:salicylate hydroxylase